MDETGEKGLEEERRLAYVGITRARQEARVSFAANRQVYGRWTSQLPSRFVDELPLANVEASSETGYYGGGPGMQQQHGSRWDESPAFGGGYSSPGWKRAQAAGYKGSHPGRKQVIEGGSEEHTSELQSLMRSSYAVFCLKKQITTKTTNTRTPVNTLYK